MEETKNKSEFIELADKFTEEAVSKYLPKGGAQKKALLVIAVDEDASEDSVLLKAAVIGKRDTLIPAITTAMADSDSIRTTINESASFYKFTNDPKKALLGILEDLLKK